MSALKSEVLMTSDRSGQMWNACVWDPETGSALSSFKGAVSSAGTLCVMGNTFLVSGNPDKPLLNVWQVNKHEQRPLKQTLPGVAGALAVSPDSKAKFLALSVNDRIYVWLTSSGTLASVMASGSGGHYQKVTGLSFTSDSAHLVSVGADGNIVVWTTANLTSANRNGAPPKPRHQWSGHSLEITGHVVGTTVNPTRVYTCSRDQTAKVHDITSGNLLLEVTFAVALTSIAVDATESTVFVGAKSGNIHKFSLRNPPRDLGLSLNANDAANTFTSGRHNKPVTGLSVSVSGTILASGSEDADVKLWDVKSGLVLRTLGHKASVTNVAFTRIVPGLVGTGTETGTGSSSSTFRPLATLAPFEKTERPIDEREVEIAVREEVPACTDLLADDDDIFPDFLSSFASATTTTTTSSVAAENGSEATSENAEVAKLKEINLQLYQHALKNILSKN